nr:hypothetical protein [Allomuricauda sp.]
MKYAFIVLLISIVSCKAQKDAPAQSDPDIVLVAQDAFSGILEYEAAVIKDAKSLNKLYARINRTRKPGLPVPQIDFSQEMVVAVCLGAQNGNPTPIITRAGESGSEGALLVELAKPSKENDIQTTVVSYPFYIYKMPFSAKKMEVQKKNW